ncbi:putative proline racemase, partial [Ophiophagus hannah]
MHAGGEPLREVVPGGLGLLEPGPELPLLSRRRHLLDSPELDAVRRLLMHEPRGHRDMYGALVVPSELSEAALGALFVHNEGASSMCGHAVLCLGRFGLDYGLCQPSPSPGETAVTIHCPCGPVTAFASWDGQRSESRVHITIDVPGYGKVILDVGYGGAFYAFLSAEQLGLDVCSSKIRDLVDAASAVTEAVKAQFKVHHPLIVEMAFIYGTILTDGKDEFNDEPTNNICVFADAQETKCGEHNAVIVEVSGESFYTGTSTFTLEENDPLKYGFFLKGPLAALPGRQSDLRMK